MCSPAGGAGNCENGREQIGRDAQRVIDRGGVEIDVGLQFFPIPHDPGDALGHLDPLRFAKLLGELDGKLAQMRCAGIEHLVNPVADAHDFFLSLQFPLDPCIDFIEIANVLKHVDDSLVGTAVQRTFERTDGCGDGRIHIGKCRNGDSGGKRGGVHAVIRMKNQCNIEDSRRRIGRHLTIQEIEKMLRLSEVFADFWELQPAPKAMIRGDDGGAFRTQRKCDGGVRLQIWLANLRPRIIEAEHGNGGAEHIHGSCIPWGAFQKTNDRLWQGTVGTETFFKREELCAVRQSVVMQEVDDFLIAAVFHELIDVVADVAEFANITNDIA